MDPADPKLSHDSSVCAESVNLAVQEHVSSLKKAEWEHAKLGQELYQFFDIFNETFFDGMLSAPIISLDGARITNLGTYRIGRNGFGAKNQIHLNRKHLNRSMIEVLATLLHEMIHQWQHDITGNCGKPPYHN